MKTSDIVDVYQDTVKVAEYIGLKHYGAIKEFSGIIETVKCLNDNSILKQTLQKPGKNKVLVVDGSASVKCALIGDVILSIALENEWSGVIINGCIRDSEQIAKMQIGLLALGTTPSKSEKNNRGEVNSTVSFAGIDFVPGQFIYVDCDGILTSPQKIIL